MPPPTHAWVAAWSSAGLGALLGPLMIARFSRLHRAHMAAR